MWERWGNGTPASIERRIGALTSEPGVLYADCGNRWSPLQCLYYDAHSLVSTHPGSSTMEVSSYYCPRCFDITNTDNRCTKCFDCPNCLSALTSISTSTTFASLPPPPAAAPQSSAPILGPAHAS